MKTATIAVSVVVVTIIILIVFAYIYFAKLRRTNDIDSKNNMLSIVVSLEGTPGKVKMVSNGGKSAAQSEAEKRANNFRYRAKRGTMVRKPSATKDNGGKPGAQTRIINVVKRHVTSEGDSSSYARDDHSGDGDSQSADCSRMEEGLRQVSYAEEDMQLVDLNGDGPNDDSKESVDDRPPESISNSAVQKIRKTIFGQ